ncbi:hypothetical protein EYC84_002078 [Monilinia fructicola]|uniref:Transmembrane protein n=1 Tax=Monilinia fructicola TaxID=38448 RepID=A0A5M9JWA8_MONFR|nr:hypothetical protein EYC84_002078 [Monilinia fructicola]
MFRIERWKARKLLSIVLVKPTKPFSFKLSTVLKWDGGELPEVDLLKKNKKIKNKNQTKTKNMIKIRIRIQIKIEGRFSAWFHKENGEIFIYLILVWFGLVWFDLICLGLIWVEAFFFFFLLPFSPLPLIDDYSLDYLSKLNKCEFDVWMDGWVDGWMGIVVKVVCFGWGDLFVALAVLYRYWLVDGWIDGLMD